MIRRSLLSLMTGYGDRLPVFPDRRLHNSLRAQTSLGSLRRMMRAGILNNGGQPARPICLLHRQPRRMLIKSVILIVAKLEKVSETA